MGGICTSESDEEEEWKEWTPSDYKFNTFQSAKLHRVTKTILGYQRIYRHKLGRMVGGIICAFFQKLKKLT
jgi:hypothetical protein